MCVSVRVCVSVHVCVSARNDNYSTWSSVVLIIKTLRCTNFSNLFWNRTVHVSDRYFVHHQDSSTVYTAIGVCHTGYADCLLAGSGCSILIQLSAP
jgi:hypothetical protein